MNLDELITAARGLSLPTATAPAWTHGAWRRHSITLADGRCDASTRVWWLQARNLSFDLRLVDGYAGTPAQALQSDAGMAHVHWDGQAMRWGQWTSLQLADRWPEPGLLRRTGDCLIEFAPSGAYVEDWRAQANAPGRFVGLELVEECDADTGQRLHAGGGLVVVGRHAGLVRGRPQPLAGWPQADADADELARVLEFDAAYAQGEGAGYRVCAALDPQRVGQPLLSLEGFELNRRHGEVLQRCSENGRALLRRFRIDTLGLADFAVATPVAGSARHWRMPTEACARPLAAPGVHACAA